MRIMYSMAMLVALAIPSLIANSLASEVVVLSVRVLENDTCWPKFQIYASRGYNTCISNNNKSGRKGGSLKTKTVKRL